MAQLFNSFVCHMMVHQATIMCTSQLFLSIRPKIFPSLPFNDNNKLWWPKTFSSLLTMIFLVIFKSLKEFHHPFKLCDSHGTPLHCCFKCLPTFPDGDLWAMLMNLEAFGLINLMNDFLLKASERRMLCVMAEIVLHGLEAYRSAVDGSSSSDTATNHGNMKHRSIKIGPKNDLPYFLCFRRHSLTPQQICPWQRSLDCLFLAQRKW